MFIKIRVMCNIPWCVYSCPSTPQSPLSSKFVSAAIGPKTYRWLLKFIRNKYRSVNHEKAKWFFKKGRSEIRLKALSTGLSSLTLVWQRIVYQGKELLQHKFNNHFRKMMCCVTYSPKLYRALGSSVNWLLNKLTRIGWLMETFL